MGAPRLEGDEVFDVILASDVIYQQETIPALVGVIRRRLAPGGTCHVYHAVRTRSLLHALLPVFAAQQLHVELQELDAASPAGSPPPSPPPASGGGSEEGPTPREREEASQPKEVSDAPHAGAGAGASGRSFWGGSGVLHRPEHYEGGYVALTITHSI